LYHDAVAYVGFLGSPTKAEQPDGKKDPLKYAAVSKSVVIFLDKPGENICYLLRPLLISVAFFEKTLAD